MKTLNFFQRWRLRSLVSAARADDAIAYLRARGLSKGESAIALSRAGMDSGAAKLAVHKSRVWRDRHEADTTFHESLERAVDELQQDGHLQRGRASEPGIGVQHKGVKITIADPASAAGGKPTPAAVGRYKEIVDRLDEIRRYAASKLLSLYNDTWRDQDHGILDVSGFAQRLTSPSLTVYEEGKTLVYFEDGDMFGGHYIEVTTQDGAPTNAEIVG
jgi:hypothetical protein